MTIWLELWMKADHRCLATCSGSSMLPKIYVFFNPWYRIITSMTKVVIYARTVCSTFGPFPSFLAAWRHPTRAPNALRIIPPTTKDHQPVRVPRQRPPRQRPWIYIHCSKLRTLSCRWTKPLRYLKWTRNQETGYDVCMCFYYHAAINLGLFKGIVVDLGDANMGCVSTGSAPHNSNLVEIRNSVLKFNGKWKHRPDFLNISVSV